MTEESFSVGIPFKYEEIDKDDDYYVSKKYDNFKDEIREYDSRNFNYVIFKNEVLTKAEQYMDSQLIKSIPPYHYNGDHEISKHHLISIILYTDYSELSSDFSGTYRKSSSFEPLSITIHRHTKYWWWGYLLSQTVLFCGINNENDKGPLKGPFFTGISFIMIVPEFNIHLQSPTSTSVHIEVAIKFSGQQGIILEFHNHHAHSQYARAFDVSSISRYPEEDERCCTCTCSYLFFFGYCKFVYILLFRLFMGSTWRALHINSIRIMETALNFEEVISAITALDLLISEFGRPSTYSHGQILSSLFNYILHGNLDKRFNKYIYDTFKLFTSNKQRIYIDFEDLDDYNENDDGKLVNLLVHRLQAVHKIKEFDGAAKYKTNMYNTNILTQQFLSIFPNLNYIRITASGIRKDFTFSLSELLSSIKYTTVKTVQITPSKEMKKLWESSSGILVEICQKENFSIIMDDFFLDLMITRN